MTARPGDMLAHYRLAEKIGEGGMGVVYKALDTRLNRPVALKFLPEIFARDPDRLTRFEREARLLAALDDPRIAAIHGFEEAGGVRFLVMELVAGETLAERLARGPLPVREALAVCLPIAAALEAAHERGIIHRDLKPANVKITPDGKVKVLDFGLAKVFAEEPLEADASQSPTLTYQGSRAGVILGTAAYMSPEQARGRPLDRRTDIWSFGCLLYETLTGRQVFEGQTASDCMARILEREPDWRALPAATPAKARDLLRRCLQKDAQRRLRDIGDARIEIDELLAGAPEAGGAETGAGAGVGEESGAGLIARLVRQPTGRLAPVALAVVLSAVLVGAAVTWLALRRTAPAPERSLRLLEAARLTHAPGLSEWPAWSPDGTLLAFASNRSGNFEIYVRRIEGGQEVNVTNDPADDIQPAFSPDGTSIAFISTRSSRTGLIRIGGLLVSETYTTGGDLWVVPALGGQARRLANDANFPVWRPGGRTVVFMSGPEGSRSVLEVSAEGGAPEIVLSSASSSWEINKLQFSPAGGWITFETPSKEILVMPAAGGPPRPLLSGSSHVWDPGGRHLYFLSPESRGGTNLQAIDIDEARAEVRGKPEPISALTGFLRDLSISRDGRHLAVSELEGALTLTRLPLTPAGDAPAGPEEVLSDGSFNDRTPAFSPDGRRIAFASNRLGSDEIWILDIVSRQMEPLRFPGRHLSATVPVWLPDGRRIIVARLLEDGGSSLWITAIDGSQSEEIVKTGRTFGAGLVSPDGRSVAYGARREGSDQIYVSDLATRKERLLTRLSDASWLEAWSPDGRWIAFVSNKDGAMQLWRIPVSGGEPERLTTGDERMRHAFYSADGRWIYIQPSHRNIYRLPAPGGPLQQVTRFPESGLYIEEPALSPDGRSLAYCRSRGGASLWLLTLGESHQETSR